MIERTLLFAWVMALVMTFPLGITIDGIDVFVVAASEQDKDPNQIVSVGLQSSASVLVAGTNANLTSTMVSATTEGDLT